ncbi:MAG: DUF4856 domain-containing protein [Oligoflexales bacterium]|nr:DUF4856 domain-containing protein [Oligoflexales bacterium]
MKLLEKIFYWHTSFLSISGLAFGNAGTSAYDQAVQTLNSAPTTISSILQNTPEIYEYSSRFDGKSSVAYKGQIFRWVLMNDFKSFIAQQSRGQYPGSKEEAKESLESFLLYRFDNDSSAPGVISGISEFQVTAKDILGTSMQISEGFIYDEIQSPGSQLLDKLAGNDNPLRLNGLKGWASGTVFGVNLIQIDLDGKKDSFFEPEDFIAAWIDVLAQEMSTGQGFEVPNGSLSKQVVTEAYVTKTGIDVAELLQKFMFSSIAFSQALEDYLNPNKGLLVDNTQAQKPEVNYTALEHHWDEGFGYFGAAQDYLKYTSKQINAQESIDTNKDGKISLLSEKNFTHARNAGRFDVSAVVPTNFANDIMSHFLMGRHLMTQRPSEYQKYVNACAAIIANRWEATIAATSIHYIKNLSSALNTYNTPNYSFKNIAKFWSELKGFSLAFQFNPNSSINNSDFELFHRLIGDSPKIPGIHSDAELEKYKIDLLEAKNMLQRSFNFDPQNVAVW